ncbi:MAG TPA: hypothetical protein H9830_02435 [Candidatus Agrococcus pullicola]|uniref:Uncharacterized protein n=1 Tax=Candidatus Agrococcus pullicola TaxID=2838429 RepID=A0A9D2C8U4_9MICO|nr:hypothetical protein [Candidatus Agrococcus pullicola]
MSCWIERQGFDANEELNHLQCATFVTVKDGLFRTMTPVGTDVHQTAPADARPNDAGFPKG